ncbi:MAG: preprotein translocase subunit SecG [Gammaproteobacteria bacterium]|jgi:preprotein translocase subunit SecG|nr:preprotein translocase subunit SecG [Gammaproteobacteria bacterium]
MFNFLLVVQILVSISIISLVMLQQGKGADMGAAFGSGASGTIFGSQGSSSFFTRATGVLAAIFFINCLLIASPLVRDSGKTSESLADQIEQQAADIRKAVEQEGVAGTLEKLQTETADLPTDLPVATEAPVAADVPAGAQDLPE